MGASGSTAEDASKMAASVGDKLQDDILDMAHQAKIDEEGTGEEDQKFVEKLSLHEKIKAGWAADRMILDLDSLHVTKDDKYWAQKARFWPQLTAKDRDKLKDPREVDMREKDAGLHVGEPHFVSTSALIVDEIGLYMRTADQEKPKIAPKKEEKKADENGGEGAGEEGGDKGEDGEAKEGEEEAEEPPDVHIGDDDGTRLYKKLVKTRITALDRDIVNMFPVQMSVQQFRKYNISHEADSDLGVLICSFQVLGHSDLTRSNRPESDSYLSLYMEPDTGRRAMDILDTLVLGPADGPPISNPDDTVPSNRDIMNFLEAVSKRGWPALRRLTVDQREEFETLIVRQYISWLKKLQEFISAVGGGIGASSVIHPVVHRLFIKHKEQGSVPAGQPHSEFFENFILEMGKIPEKEAEEHLMGKHTDVRSVFLQEKMSPFNNTGELMRVIMRELGETEEGVPRSAVIHCCIQAADLRSRKTWKPSPMRAFPAEVFDSNFYDETEMIKKHNFVPENVSLDPPGSMEMAVNKFNKIPTVDEKLKDRLQEWKGLLEKAKHASGTYVLTYKSEAHAQHVRTEMIKELTGANEDEEDGVMSPKKKLSTPEAEAVVVAKKQSEDKQSDAYILTIDAKDAKLLGRIVGDALTLATAREIDLHHERELVCRGKVVQMRLMSNRIELLHETDLEAAERMTDSNFAGLKKEIIPLEQVKEFEVNRFDDFEKKKLKNTVYIHGNSSQADRVWALRMDVDVLEEIYEILNHHSMLKQDSVIINYTGAAREHADIPDAFIRQGEFGSQVFPPTTIAQKHKMPCQTYVGAWADHRYHLNGGLSVLHTATEDFEKRAAEERAERDDEARTHAQELTKDIRDPTKKAKAEEDAFEAYVKEHQDWFDEGIPTKAPPGDLRYDGLWSFGRRHGRGTLFGKGDGYKWFFSGMFYDDVPTGWGDLTIIKDKEEGDPPEILKIGGAAEGLEEQDLVEQFDLEDARVDRENSIRASLDPPLEPLPRRFPVDLPKDKKDAEISRQLGQRQDAVNAALNFSTLSGFDLFCVAQQMEGWGAHEGQMGSHGPSALLSLFDKFFRRMSEEPTKEETPEEEEKRKKEAKKIEKYRSDLNLKKIPKEANIEQISLSISEREVYFTNEVFAALTDFNVFLGSMSFFAYERKPNGTWAFRNRMDKLRDDQAALGIEKLKKFKQSEEQMIIWYDKWQDASENDRGGWRGMSNRYNVIAPALAGRAAGALLFPPRTSLNQLEVSADKAMGLEGGGYGFLQLDISHMQDNLGTAPTSNGHGLHVTAKKDFNELQFSGCPMQHPLETEFHDWDTDPFNDENPALIGAPEKAPIVALYNRMTRGAEVYKACGMVMKKKIETRKHNKRQEIDFVVLHDRGYPRYGFAQEMDFGKAPSLFKHLKGGMLVRYTGFFFRGFYANVRGGAKPAIVQIFQESTKSKEESNNNNDPKKKASHILTYEGGYEPSGRTGHGKIIVNPHSVKQMGYSSFEGEWKDGGMYSGTIKADLPDMVWKYTGKFDTTGRATDGVGENDGKMEIKYKDPALGSYVFQGKWAKDVPAEGTMTVYDGDGNRRFEYVGHFEDEDGLFDSTSGFKEAKKKGGLFGGNKKEEKPELNFDDAKKSKLTREPDDETKRSTYIGHFSRGKFEGYGEQEQLVKGTKYIFRGKHHLGMRNDPDKGTFVFDDTSKLQMQMKKGGCCFSKPKDEGTTPIRRTGLFADCKSVKSKPERKLTGPWCADHPVTGAEQLEYVNEYGEYFKVHFDEDNQVKPPGCRLGCDPISIAGGVICVTAFGCFGVSSFGLCNVGREPPGKTPTKLNLLQAWRLMAVSEPWGMQGSELPKSSDLLLKYTVLPGAPEHNDNYINSLPETTYVLPEAPDPIKAVNRMIREQSSIKGEEKPADPKDSGMLPLDLWFREHTQVKAKKKKSMAGRALANVFGMNTPETQQTEVGLKEVETRGDLDRSKTQLERGETDVDNTMGNTLAAASEERLPLVSEGA